MWNPNFVNLFAQNLQQILTGVHIRVELFGYSNNKQFTDYMKYKYVHTKADADK